MKTLLLLIGIYLAIPFQNNALPDTQDTAIVNEITWYGLDFSNVRLIGAIGFNEPEKIKSYYFGTWNSLILDEYDKYNLKKFFYVGSVKNDLSVVMDRNKLPDAGKLVIENDYSFDVEKVMQIISEYDSGDKKGIGLVFIVESLNKYKEKASVWVTFFDIQTKKVLLAKRIEGKAGGFGFRNYWAGAYYNVMKTAYKSININSVISN